MYQRKHIRLPLQTNNITMIQKEMCDSFFPHVLATIVATSSSSLEDMMKKINEFKLEVE